MKCLLDEATLFLTSIYHSIAPDKIEDHEPPLGHFLIQPEQDTNITNRNSWDGNLLIQLNENIQNKYRVIDLIRYGKTSCLYKCQDIENPTQFFSIKVLKLGHESESNEIQFLQLLNSTEISGKQYIENYLDFFEYQGHSCLLMPLLSHSIEDSINYTIPLTPMLQTIRYYLIQVLTGISYVHSQNIIHSDIKPLNLLFRDETMNQLQIVDFSLSTYNNTPNRPIQTRSYSSPELLLDLPYNELIDIWSIGCVAAELYLNFVPFGCDTDFDCVHAIAALLGPIDPDMVILSSVWWKYFDVSPYGFSYKADPYTVLIQRHSNPSVFTTGSLHKYLLKDYIRLRKVPRDDEENNLIESFTDLVLRMLTINPEQRISANQALQHPFIVGNHFDSIWKPPPEERVSLFASLRDKTDKTDNTPVESSQSESDYNTSDFLSMF